MATWGFCHLSSQHGVTATLENTVNNVQKKSVEEEMVSLHAIRVVVQGRGGCCVVVPLTRTRPKEMEYQRFRNNIR